jgi:polyphosphate kinase 2 (PPK2 family)
VPGTTVDLGAFEPGATHGHEKAESEQELAAGLERLSELQDRLWEEAKHAVLVVLQGIDAVAGTARSGMSWARSIRWAPR